MSQVSLPSLLQTYYPWTLADYARTQFSVPCRQNINLCQYRLPQITFYRNSSAVFHLCNIQQFRLQRNHFVLKRVHHTCMRLRQRLRRWNFYCTSRFYRYIYGKIAQILWRHYLSQTVSQLEFAPHRRAFTQYYKWMLPISFSIESAPVEFTTLNSYHFKHSISSLPSLSMD